MRFKNTDRTLEVEKGKINQEMRFGNDIIREHEKNK
jgi:hypothetical protein